MAEKRKPAPEKPKPAEKAKPLHPHVAMLLVARARSARRP